MAWSVLGLEWPCCSINFGIEHWNFRTVSSNPGLIFQTMCIVFMCYCKKKINNMLIV